MRLIQSLASKELVRNLPKLKFDQHFYDACKIRKQADTSHKAKNIVLTTRCLKLLQMDLFGPSVVRSYRGNRYTLVLVDDYSRYTWTRFLKDKTEAFDQFEIFSKKIQNQLGCTIVSIRTDQGREFDNEVQFREFCNANGITHNFSAPRTPQSNGMVERKNRTLQEMSRTMLNEQSLPQKFWCNTIDTSTYILNRILIRSILGKTPYELLRGRKPTLDYFRVFGSKKIEESLNVTFDETPPPSKTSPLVDDDLDEEEAIKVTEKKNLENDIEDETLEIDEIVNIKESRKHPLENVIGNLNQRTLRLVAQGYNQQEGIDYDETYALVARLESNRILLAYACALDFKLFQILVWAKLVEQTQPEYLQELLQSLLKDLQILNEIQPLKQEIPNQIQKDQEEKSIVELLAEERIQKANQVLNEVQSSQEMRIQDLEIQKQQCLEEMKEWINELGIREYQKEEIDIDYRRKCEDKIYELKDKFNGLSIEIRKIIQEAEELRKSEARARSQKIIIDDDDDDLGFYAVHPNTIHTPVSQNVEPKDSLIMGDGNINTTPETETISVESLVSNPSESDDFSLGECNLFNIDDSYYEKSTSRLDHLAPISPEIVEVCVDNDDTDDDDDCDMPVCDESSPIFTIFSNPLFDSNENFSSDDESLFEEEIQKDEFNSFSNPLYDIDDEIITNEKSLLNRDSPIDSTKTDSIFDEFSFPRLPEEHNSENVDTIIESLSYSPIPVEDSDSLIEEIDLFLTSDDSMPRALRAMIRLGRVAVTNDFDVLNDVESFDSGEGENVDSLNVEEEDSFTFTIRSFLPFVTYPEVLPASYSTGSEDKVFNPGIFDKDAFKDKSSKELAPSKALLTLKIFDPPHPPLMDFNVTKAFFGFTFSLLKIFSKKFVEPGIKNATGFPGFGSFMVHIVGRTTQFHNFHHGLQSSLHNKKGLKRQKEAKTIKNRQGTKETRKRVKKQPKIKTGSADTARKAVKGQNNEAKD
ncbi:retrovirus-related pol polyprotein from transposon TNT 1-94 [Tanacetum coccineum]